MSVEQPARTSPWWLSIGWLCLLLAHRLLALQRGALVEQDAEEGFNAAQGWLLLHGHLPDLFALQYRPYCGGCSLAGMASAALFSALPPAWIVAKLLPVGAWGLALVCGQRTLHRYVGWASGALFSLMMILPPRAPLVLSGIGWGNHMEAGALAVVFVAAVGRPAGLARGLAAGLIGGLALYVSFSGAFVAAAAALFLAMELRRRPTAALGALGLLIGPLMWGLQRRWSGNQPFHTIYAEREWLPLIERLPDKLISLFAPNQIAALMGHPSELGRALSMPVALSLGLAAALSLGRRSRVGRWAAGLIGLWLLAYLSVGFSVRVSAPPELSFPASLRYAAAVMPLCALLLAAAAGSGARWRRALVAPALLVGIIDLQTVIGEDDGPPSTASAPWALDWAADWAYVSAQLSYALPMERHRACRSADPVCRRLHAYAEGRDAATAALREDPEGRCSRPISTSTAPHPAWAEGVGDAVAQARAHDRGAAEARLSALGNCVRGLVPDEGEAQRLSLRRAVAGVLAGAEPPVLSGDAASEGAALDRALGALPPADQAALLFGWARRWGGREGPPIRAGWLEEDALRAALIDGWVAGGATEAPAALLPGGRAAWAAALERARSERRAPDPHGWLRWLEPGP